MGSIHGPVKSDTVSPSARLRCDVSSELRCSGEDGPRLSLRALTKYRKYTDFFYHIPESTIITCTRQQ